ncbi:bifunctional diaminohydroxyphosphoribosylaminopyrimidine deaminase/5-amino-6-(5-phosphoribosylamino)uracil reductase RibD [Aestuariivirga litoralis]|uniref:bifunctional diaminohydroxyphosphoribosylaminopyrimidine deaminase/5-amino-6-(5-phosphoribosylamino)uracil reductase RibD n=1 Tax=Aestuariivirga litoralis TaxID=2650924 RepID=UPI001FDFD75A|nr:bifunctional diaminohydroxyphosphoribosylaminopyrimidine deaminase/5-amino-6-(5-phosphoribosylamino)uracil reductase RibD [Aestuariivirga litoralis]
MTTDDARWMDLALRLGRRALGTTAENPNVGCVIVRDGRLLGIGWTQPGGRPHAETEALKMAGSKSRGATAYVTLEPCAHHGKTGPCAEALVAAGIARVVTAIEDPDPRVSGGGFDILRRAGVSCEAGVGADEARRDMAGFLTRITKKRPQVILKMAFSADGKIAAGVGRRTAISGPEAKARVHLLRAQCNAILVGMGTVRADDPELTCRLPGLRNRSPKPFVMSRHGQLPPGSHLAKQGAEVLRGTARQVVAELGQRGINRLMVEGGARVARSFLEDGLVDEFHLIRSPVTLGPDGVDGLAGLPLAQALQPFVLLEQEKLGSDLLTVYEARQ